MRLLIQVFHIILGPLLLRVGTDVLAQLRSEAVGKEMPAQLDETLLGVLRKRRKGVERRGLWP